MQDGASKDGEAASAWLREHFADDPAPSVNITWTVADSPQPAKLARMAEILFGPQLDSDAA